MIRRVIQIDEEKCNGLRRMRGQHAMKAQLP